MEDAGTMSAWGHKQTLKRLHPMSALPLKADIAQHDRNVRFVPKADIGGHSITSSVSAMSEGGTSRPRITMGYPRAPILSCVLVSKSLASWRSCNCSSGGPLVRLTIRPRLTAARSIPLYRLGLLNVEWCNQPSVP